MKASFSLVKEQTSRTNILELGYYWIIRLFPIFGGLSSRQVAWERSWPQIVAPIAIILICGSVRYRSDIATTQTLKIG